VLINTVASTSGPDELGHHLLNF